MVAIFGEIIPTPLAAPASVIVAPPALNVVEAIFGPGVGRHDRTREIAQAVVAQGSCGFGGAVFELHEVI